MYKIRLVTLDQWDSTRGTRTPGDTRRHLRGYVKLKKIYNMILLCLLFNSLILLFLM
jgi:hypothetical protein